MPAAQRQPEYDAFDCDPPAWVKQASTSTANNVDYALRDRFLQKYRVRCGAIDLEQKILTAKVRKGLKRQYVSLLKDTYTAGEGDPGVIVIVAHHPGVSGVAWTTNLSPIAAGLLNYSDCIGARQRRII